MLLVVTLATNIRRLALTIKCYHELFQTNFHTMLIYVTIYFFIFTVKNVKILPIASLLILFSCIMCLKICHLDFHCKKMGSVVRSWRVTLLCSWRNKPARHCCIVHAVLTAEVTFLLAFLDIHSDAVWENLNKCFLIIGNS